jgi:hypothetical protein
MLPTTSLPVNYKSVGTLDLSSDRRKLTKLNILAIGLFLFSTWIFGLILGAIRRADSAQLTFSVSSLPDAIGIVLLLLLVTAIMLLLHEAAHGVFFWRYTRERPMFALRLSYAFTAAPRWYIPKQKYLVVALAPLVLVSLLGILLAFIVPAGWLRGLWLLLVLNTSGAVGDLYVVGWLLRQPDTCLARDQGDMVTLYIPK